MSGDVLGSAQGVILAYGGRIGHGHSGALCHVITWKQTLPVRRCEGTCWRCTAERRAARSRKTAIRSSAAFAGWPPFTASQNCSHLHGMHLVPRQHTAALCPPLTFVRLILDSLNGSPEP